MRSCGYYTKDRQNESNFRINTVPLAVNCAGVEYTNEPFNSYKIRNDYQLIYVTHDMLPVTVNNATHKLTAGSFIILEPDIYYGYFSETHPTYYWIHFSGSDVEKILKNLILPTNTAIKIGVDEEIISCYTRIFTEFMISDRHFETTTSSILSELFVYLSRKSNSDTKFPLASMNYINTNYNKNITLEELAELENLSISRYRTIFKNSIGMSPQEYLIQQRINVACQRLSQTNLPVEEISNYVGYSDPFYFSRIFKKKTGMSPMQYHKLHNTVHTKKNLPI